MTTTDSHSKTSISAVIDITQFSSMTRLLRATAYVLKFMDLCRKSCNKNEKQLTASDLLKAERIWIKTIQGSSFEAELLSLQGQSTATLLQKQLDLFIDQEGIV